MLGMLPEEFTVPVVRVHSWLAVFRRSQVLGLRCLASEPGATRSLFSPSQFLHLPVAAEHGQPVDCLQAWCTPLGTLLLLKPKHSAGGRSWWFARKGCSSHESLVLFLRSSAHRSKSSQPGLLQELWRKHVLR